MTKNVLPADVKFAHFPDNKFTIGYQLNDEKQVLTYAVAYTHPNDTYNHKIARGIVAGRILKGGTNRFGKRRSYSIPYATLKDGLDGKEIKHGNIIKYIEECRL